MDNGRKYILEKEIDYWTTHQDLDKFNYNRATSTYLSIISIAVAVWIGLTALSIYMQNITIMVWVSIFIFIVLIASVIFYLKNTSRHNTSFIVREEMIKKRYELLGVKKDQLNEEFVETKKKLKGEKGKKEIPSFLITLIIIQIINTILLIYLIVK